MVDHIGVREILSSDQITFGVTAPMDADLVAEFEQLGVESLWAGGHIASRNPSPEALMYLAMVAARSTVPIGTSILLLPLYAPAIVAKQIADLDNATGGRVILGIGVGGEYPQEFRAVQVDMADRGRRTNEAIPLIRRFWTGESVTHDGPFFPVEDVKIHPEPRQEGGPPIVVSGRQEPAIRRAARLGDGWMPYMYSPRRYAKSVAGIQQHAAEASRDLTNFGWMAYVPVCIDADAAVARREGAAFLGGTYQQDFEQLITRIGAVGTVDDVVARCVEYFDAGVRHFIFLTTRMSDSRGQVKLLTEEVMPALRSHRASSARS